MRTVTIIQAFTHQGTKLANGSVQSLPDDVAADAVNNGYASYGISANTASKPEEQVASVRYDISQSLTTDQKTQARTNIGAGDGSGTGNVTAAVEFGTDGLIIVSDGVTRGVKSTSTVPEATITSLTATNLIQAVPSVDGTSSGPKTSSFNCGYSSSAVGDLVYLDSSATWQKTDANTTAMYDGLLGIALEVKSSGQGLSVALPGSFVYATAFPTLTIGDPVFISETAGAITQTAPTTTDAATRVIGWAVHADKIFFSPSADYVTHT